MSIRIWVSFLKLILKGIRKHKTSLLMIRYNDKIIQVSKILDDLNIFQRNKVPKEVKYLVIAMYFQTSSLRKTVIVLSEIHPGSKISVWRWIKKVEAKLPDPKVICQSCYMKKFLADTNSGCPSGLPLTKNLITLIEEIN